MLSKMIADYVGVTWFWTEPVSHYIGYIIPSVSLKGRFFIKK